MIFGALPRLLCWMLKEGNTIAPWLFREQPVGLCCGTGKLWTHSPLHPYLAALGGHGQLCGLHRGDHKVRSSLHSYFASNWNAHRCEGGGEVALGAALGRQSGQEENEVVRQLRRRKVENMKNICEAHLASLRRQQYWIRGMDAALDVIVVNPCQTATVIGAATTAGHALNFAHTRSFGE